MGGKTRLADRLVRYMPLHYNNYYEPFIGGGSLLLRVQPKRAVINDANPELICAWKGIRDNPSKVLSITHDYYVKNSRAFFMNIRNVDRTGVLSKMSTVQRAARFLYLDFHCFNGKLTVNKKGQFECSYRQGLHISKVSHKLVYLISEYLNSNDIKIVNTDYKKAIAGAKKGDFVYLDPPYVPQKDNFDTNYTKNRFRLPQQFQLLKICKRLSCKGVKVMLSNSNTQLTRFMYRYFNVHHVYLHFQANPHASRGVSEIVVTNY